MENIEVWNKSSNKIPIVVSIPHSGTYLPKEMKDKLIDNVVLPNMDWYLPELYSFLHNLEVTTIVNNVSRYVIDTNREIVDLKNDSYTKSYVYTKTTFNYEMYKRTLTDIEVNNRIQSYYKSYHKTIQNIINNKLKTFHKIYLLDLHSFGKNIEEDIVLGNKNGQTASDEFTRLVQGSLVNKGFRVSLNNPYSGGYIIKKYANDNVETIQIELSYKKYIDNRIFENEEFPKIDENLFYNTQYKLKSFFNEIIKQL